MAEKIEFDLEVKKNELNSALDSGAKKASELNGILKTAAGVFVGNIATKGFEQLTKAIDNSIDFAKESIKAYSEQEDALNKLGQALRASGDFSEEAIADFSDFATELQRTSKFGDEVVLSQLALAKALGATNTKAKEIVQAAAELSAVFGGSLEENVAKLGKTLSGEIGRLGQLIPQLKELTAEQLRAGEAAAIINQRFSGSAASELDTYTGSIIASSNAFSDLQEEIGSVLVDVLRLKDINNFLATVYQTLTDKVLGFRESLSRGNDGFKENEGSITRLSGKIAELTSEIEIQESRLADYEKQAKTSFSAAGQVTFAKQELKSLRAEYDETIKTINKFYEEQNKPPPTTGEDPAKKLTESQKILNQEILSLKEQAKLQERTLEEQYANQAITDEFARNQAELQRIADFDLQKSELEFALKQKRLEATLSGQDEILALQKLGLEKELAQNKIYGDLKTKQKQNETKQLESTFAQQNKLDQQTLQTRLGYLQAFGNLASAVAKDGSKEQFYIQKAAAIAGSIVATQLAAAQALASAPPPGNIALAKTVTTIGAINTAAIAATAIKGFANGGIVGEGATMGGDNRLATIRDGEMVLNADQQKNLMNMINQGTMGSGEIVIQIDGRTIAKAVRDQINNGFKLA
jgi:hypothetical protein